MLNCDCYTNIDNMKDVKWPTSFVFPPRVGDKVEGEDARGGAHVLTVVRITHTMRHRGPVVMVELHR